MGLHEGKTNKNAERIEILLTFNSFCYIIKIQTNINF